MSLLAAIFELVAKAVELLFKAIRFVVMETIAAVCTIIVLLSIYRASELDWSGDAEHRRGAAIAQGSLVCVDVVALPLAGLMLLTWHRKDVIKEYEDWSKTSAAFECAAIGSFFIFLYDLFDISLLLFSFFSWNRSKATEALDAIFSCNTPRRCDNLALFFETLMEWVLYSVAFPLLTFSWRAPSFYSTLGDKWSNMTRLNFDMYLLDHASSALMDLALLPFFLITACSWRSCLMLKAIWNETTDEGRWWQIVYHTGMMFLELLFAPLMLLLTVCFWRARSAWRIVLGAGDWKQKLQQIALEMLQIAPDIPCIVLGLLLCATIYRAPVMVQLLVRQLGGKLEPNQWRTIVLKQFLIFLLDMLILPFFLTTIVTLVRIPILFQPTDSDFTRWEAEIAHADFYVAYRLNSLKAAGELLLDTLAIVSFCISFCCPWRTVQLVATVICDDERLTLAGLASALEDEKTRQLIEVHRLNRLLDDLSSSALLRSQSLWEATVEAMRSARSPFLQSRIVSRLERGITGLRTMEITEKNQSYLTEVKRLCGIGHRDVEETAGPRADTNLLLDLGRARMQTSEVVKPTWMSSDEPKFFSWEYTRFREQYLSRQAARRVAIARWLRFWATYDPLLHPPALEFGCQHFTWKRARLLCYYYALNTFLDLSLIPALLALALTGYRLPSVVADFSLLKTMRALRFAVIDQVYEMAEDMRTVVLWVFVVACLTRLPELLTGTYEAVVVRRSAVFWRGVTLSCWRASVEDLRHALSMIFSCRMLAYVFWSSATTVLLPGVLTYQLIINKDGGKRKNNDVAVFVAKFLAAVFNTAIFVIPAVFLFEFMPRAIEQLDDDASKSKDAETVALGSLGAFFAVMGCFVLYSLWTFSTDGKLSGVLVPYSADGKLVYMRKNWANVIAIVGLLLDAVQLGTLVFAAGNIDIAEGLADVLHDIGAGVLLNDFEWAAEAPGSDTATASKYGQNEVAVYFKFGLLGLWVVTMTMPIVWDELSGANKGMGPSLYNSSLFRAARSALGGAGFLVLVEFALTFLACDYDTNPPTLRADPSVECFQSEHLIFAALSFFGLAFYLPTALVFTAYGEDGAAAQSNADLDWSRLYEVVTSVAKLAITATLVLSGVTTTACVVVAVISACVVIFSVVYRPLLGSPPCTAPEGTVLRAVSFALCFWAAIAGYHGLPSQDQPTTAARIVIVGWALTGLVAMVALVKIRVQRAAAMREKDDQACVQRAVTELKHLVSSLPPNVFTCDWYEAVQGRWLKQAKHCKSFPQVVELTDALVAQLREEAFAPGVFSLDLYRDGNLVPKLIRFEEFRQQFPGVQAWWPLRGKLVQSARALDRLVSDLRQSLDKDLFTECQPPAPAPAAAAPHVFEKRTQPVQQPNSEAKAEEQTVEAITAEQEETAKAAESKNPDKEEEDEMEEKEEADDDVDDEDDDDDDDKAREDTNKENNVAALMQALEEVELAQMRESPAPVYQALAPPTAPAGCELSPLQNEDAPIVRELLTALPPQQACLFDVSMVDPELLSVLQMWLDVQEIEPQHVPPGVEHVPMSSLIVTSESQAVLHPALIYADPALMEYFLPSSVDASKRYVFDLNESAEQAADKLEVV